MTARELLREVADWIERAHSKPDIEANMLRALADRIDAEEKAAQLKVNECVRAENASALATWLMIEKLLTRLDAPLTPN